MNRYKSSFHFSNLASFSCQRSVPNICSVSQPEKSTFSNSIGPEFLEPSWHKRNQIYIFFSLLSLVLPSSKIDLVSDSSLQVIASLYIYILLSHTRSDTTTFILLSHSTISSFNLSNLQLATQPNSSISNLNLQLFHQISHTRFQSHSQLHFPLFTSQLQLQFAFHFTSSAPHPLLEV